MIEVEYLMTNGSGVSYFVVRADGRRFQMRINGERKVACLAAGCVPPCRHVAPLLRWMRDTGWTAPVPS